MKKHLLSTSAIALGVAVAAPASAEEWTLTWGGFMQQHVAWTDSSGTGLAAGTDFDGVDVSNNSEIIFSPSITLDNGLTFGVTIQMEGNNNGGGATGIDETFMTISGDTLGRIEVGNMNSAGYKSMVAAPSVTSMGINSPSTSSFIPNSAAGFTFGFRTAMSSAWTEVGAIFPGGNNDVPRISYYTPDFNGLTVGVSYASRTATNAGNNFSVNKNATISDVFDIGAIYSQTFGTTSVTLSGRYGTGKNPVVGISDPVIWAVGAQVGFGDFTVGGHFASDDNGGVGGVGDQQSYSFGVTYDAPGAWAFEAQMFMGETKLAVGDATYDAYKIGASRSLGAGVAWDIYAIQSEFDTPAAGTVLKSTTIGTGINLSF